jgi:CubicO group peptidase (beta-lactamase class C family)
MTAVDGFCDPRYELVRQVFRENFERRGDVGAAVAVYEHGEPVVDLWGGIADPRTQRPWERDTLVTLYSTTKGIAAATFALAHSRGLVDFEAPVKEYWPEFAQAGKGEVTVRQLLAHQAGLCAVAGRLTPAVVGDAARLAEVLAAERPAWRPGDHHGYHVLSLGWYQSAILRRADPRGRSLGEIFRDEIAGPLDLDIHIGLPDTVGDERIARVSSAPVAKLLDPRTLPRRMLVEFLNPRSLTSRAFTNPRLGGLGQLASRPWRSMEVPSGTGMGTARSIARLYGDLALGGERVGWTPATFDEVIAPDRPPLRSRIDRVLKVEASYSLGFIRPMPRLGFGGDARSFGHPGAGGSFGFADVANGIGFAYTPNLLGHYLDNDPRERALRKAVAACAAAPALAAA